MHLGWLSAGLVFTAIASVPGADPGRSGPVPLINAHAHNDYEHSHPLFDALSHGLCSVEADIYLVNGRLLVAHDRDQVRPERTLEALYLDPLRVRIRRNHGRLYPHGPVCTLLIDVKSDAEKTYAVLRGVLRDYADILTVFRGEEMETRAITVIISGNRARAMMAAELIRYAAVDGVLADLDSKAPATFIPWISDNWRKTFKWPGYGGPMPAVEKQKLAEIVARAHQQGRKVRFWGAPDFPAFWQVLWDAHVDLINTDDLAGVEKFLLAKMSSTGRR
ncbi:MAG: phosphatidylinositol-specific phospholipase C/glycerophosphodiester phosphodiesterase family protein [Verrucomicrobia bacterium]|nr:phosphatidylinositol-specific phospholipase C/glycerophosphodiester phosphodiesterase family protein [Verrucomicrobiota bacterium]